MEKRSLTCGQAVRGFLLATVVFLAIFAATAVPVPLYATYQQTIGLSTGDMAASMVLYEVGVCVVLLLAGRISDALGRKTVTLFTVVLAILGCALFMVAQNPFMVLAARFLQGISAGFAMSAVSALVVDCIAGYNMGWGSIVASCGSLMGIMVGSLGVGVLYDMFPYPVVIYGVMIAVLAVCMLMMPAIPEPIERRASLRAATRFKVFIPQNARRLFLMTAVAYIVPWGVTCFFQAYSATIAADIFHADTPMLGSILLVLILAPSVLGGPLTAHLHSENALRLGILLFTVGTFGLAWSIIFGWGNVFLACCVIDAFASGACMTTTLRMSLLSVGPYETSAIIASVNLAAYAGSAAMSAFTGWLLDVGNYTLVFTVLGVLGAASAVLVYYITWIEEGKHNVGELARTIRVTLSRGMSRVHLPRTEKAGAFALTAKALKRRKRARDEAARDEFDELSSAR